MEQGGWSPSHGGISFLAAERLGCASFGEVLDQYLFYLIERVASVAADPVLGTDARRDIQELLTRCRSSCDSSRRVVSAFQARCGLLDDIGTTGDVGAPSLWYPPSFSFFDPV